MKSEKGQFSFVWLFAIVAGGAILFLAIYGALRFGETAKYQSDTEIAKSIAIITDPLQAGFAEGSFGKILFNQETRMNNDCYDFEFGRNEISVSARSDIGEEWSLPGGATSIYNKYIFSSGKSSGLDYYVFSEPFNFPYEVSDLIFIAPENYCFINMPDDLLELDLPNVEVNNCSVADATRVCFGFGDDCDMIVYGSCFSGCDSVYDEGVVVKDGLDMKYVGSLMYGAIFSDKGIYDCNVRRLMYRAGKIAEGFVDKADLMDARNCNTNLKPDLIIWRGMIDNASVDDLSSLRTMANAMDRKNSKEACGMW
jgi:hypothetical protein